MPVVRAPRVPLYHKGFTDRLRTLAGLGQDEPDPSGFNVNGGDFSDWGGDSSSYGGGADAGGSTGDTGPETGPAGGVIIQPETGGPGVPIDEGPAQGPFEAGMVSDLASGSMGDPSSNMAAIEAGYDPATLVDLRAMGADDKDIQALAEGYSLENLLKDLRSTEGAPDAPKQGKAGGGSASGGGAPPPSSSAPGKAAPAPSPSVAQKKTPQGLKAVTDWLGQDSLVKGYPNALVAGGGFLAFTALTNMLGGGGKKGKKS